MFCGIVVAGGQSRRMGTPKAELDWHGTSLVQRTVNVLATVCDEVLVVAAPGQDLTADGARIVRDRVQDRGPLQALSAGLDGALELGAAKTFVCATDMPMLHPAFVSRMLGALTEDVDVALPVAECHEHPLAAAYATSLAPVVAELLDSGELRLRELLRHCRVRRLSRAELLADDALAEADPELDSLVNVNTPQQLAQARGRTGQSPSRSFLD